MDFFTFTLPCVTCASPDGHIHIIILPFVSNLKFQGLSDPHGSHMTLKVYVHKGPRLCDKDIPINDPQCISLLGTPVSPEGHIYFPEAHLCRSRASVTPIVNI